MDIVQKKSIILFNQKIKQGSSVSQRLVYLIARHDVFFLLPCFDGMKESSLSFTQQRSDSKHVAWITSETPPQMALRTV
jgi:hypothetical protein